ncbi:MAG: NAD(P)/FAD-dependent oxidoreductase [Dehalococcoidia bacterium]
MVVNSSRVHDVIIAGAGPSGSVLGDAAGLIDPFSGDGIYYAIHSAQLASPVIVRILESGSIDFTEYQRAVDEELGPLRLFFDMVRGL